jgi:hypothetical protein
MKKTVIDVCELRMSSTSSGRINRDSWTVLKQKKKNFNISNKYMSLFKREMNK